jgi:hypothetical protein
MPAIALAPSSRILPGSSFDPVPIPLTGHSLAAYAQFFALDVAAWRGRDVLDVAAGVSSFTAEACARRVAAVAVDPCYAWPADVLAARVRQDSLAAAAEPEERSAAQRFLADYETHFVHNRYVAGALPQLPFFDGTFDLVLCAHLAFSAARRGDFDWHVAACRELVRVSAGEVRLHPLVSEDGRPYRDLPRLRRELKAGGIASEILAVPGGTHPGAGAALVLRRAAS